MTLINGFTASDRMDIGEAERPIIENGASVHFANEYAGVHDQRGKRCTIPTRFEEEPIAIVGMACRFAGDAVDVKGLWDMCCEGRSAWSELPDSRMNGHAFYHPDFNKRGTFNMRGAHFLKEDVSLFDAPFFSISPTEAKSMDPQQRAMLECTYEALENGGIPLRSIVGKNVGVYIAASTADHFINNVKDSETIPTYLMTGSVPSMLSNRISYTFDLKGPSFTADSACSSSLTALHLACQSLKTGECEQAIVGGVQILLSPDAMMVGSSMGSYSDEGRCFTFDSRANGYGRGEGVATIILRPLSEAIKNNDPIRAIIRNTGVAQDGKTNGISVPNGKAQEQMVKATYTRAGLDPSETSYVEAHGTGTAVGDPIEAKAISHSFAQHRLPGDPVIVGSLKTNIGHTEAVSGLAGLIKAALIVQTGLIPPNFDFRTPNPNIPLQQLKLKVPTDMMQWPSSAVRRASVCSYGFGGTNAHTIVECWYPEKQQRHLHSRASAKSVVDPPEATILNGSPDHNHEMGKTSNTADVNGKTFVSLSTGTSLRKLFVLSAVDQEATRAQVKRLAAYLKLNKKAQDQDFWRDLAYTLTTRRSLFAWRIAVHASALGELIRELERPGLEPRRVIKAPRVGFVFTGQGSQWARMGQELMRYDVFAESMQEAERCLRGFGCDWSLLDELAKDAKDSRIDRPYISQPSSTACQIALVRLLASWNIFPTAVTGHSSGEIAAAFAVGALPLSSCMGIAYHRGILSGKITRDGSMLAIGTSALGVESLLAEAKSDKATIACFNSPALTTVSGDSSTIHTLQKLAEERNVFVRRLKVDVAYHSYHMQDVAASYLTALESLGIRPTSSKSISFYSSLTGKSMSTVGLDADYWCRNMTHPVLFFQSCQNMLLAGQNDTSGPNVEVLVEIGPHSSLKSPLQDILKANKLADKITYLPSLLRQTDGLVAIHELASRMFALGSPVDTLGVNFGYEHDSIGGNVLTDLPAYPWTHKTSLWNESRLSKNHRFRRFPRHDLLGALVDDFNEMDMRWRGVIRLSEVPWLSHHKIQGSTIFPGMGYVSMAIEAAYQHAMLHNIMMVKSSSYLLREVAIMRPLILDSSEEVETSVTLKAMSQGSTMSSELWNEFSVYSWTDDGGWSEHCRGLISIVDSGKVPNSIDGERTIQSHHEAIQKQRIEQRRRCYVRVDGVGAYRKFSRAGFEYGPTFRNLVDGYVGGGHCVASVVVPDTATTMPCQFENDYVVHPALLDSCAHPTLVASKNGDSRLALRVPYFAKTISISHDISRQAGHLFQAYANVDSGYSDRSAEASIMLFDDNKDVCKPFVEIHGLMLSTLPNQDTDYVGASRGLCYKLRWEASLALLSRSQFRKLLPNEPGMPSQIEGLERAAFYYIQKAMAKLSDHDIQNALPHHQKQIRVFKKLLALGEEGKLPYQKPSWITSDEDRKHDHLLLERNSSDCGKMTCEMGDHILHIWRQEIDPLSLMLKDHLLERFYQDLQPLQLANAKCAEWAQEYFSHQIPNMNVIEVGAGTGGTTFPILKALSDPSKGVRRFSHYTFTDISAGFFERAREHLTYLGDLVEYKTLNIERDPVDQGFVLESYDLVIASNVLHATTNLEHTVENTRKLLKPGGKLLFVETTALMCLSTLTFGTLPGWWVAEEPDRQDAPTLTEEQWDALLQVKGFSGLDGSISCGDDNVGSVMISTAKVSSNVVWPHPEVLAATGHEELEAASILGKALSTKFGGRQSVTSLDQSKSVENPYLIILTLDQPVWSNLTGDKFSELQSLLTRSKGILWVTRGAADSSPDANLLLGLSRCLRSENQTFNLITLDLGQRDPLSDADTVDLIYRTFTHSFDPENQGFLESEYRERQGVIQIPRMVADVEKDEFIMQDLNGSVPYAQEFLQDKRPLTLKLGTPGLLDTIYFDDVEQVWETIGDDEVEIAVKAAGMNFKDIMIALGQLPYQDMGFECSGTVTRVGKDVGNVQVGNLVCGVTQRAFSSVVRTHQSLVSHVPHGMDCKAAAAFPLVFCTALFSLKYVARLERGESILIHCAAGGVGQAAVMLARHIEAEIFVTVSSPEKRSLVSGLYNIPEDHVFSSRDTTFEIGVKRMTNGAGVDVVLNCLAGEALQASWNCLASFGRFVEIGKRDLVQNNRLEMDNFNKSVTFSAVDLALLVDQKPHLVRKMLAEIVDMFNCGSINSVSPFNVYAMSDIQEAMRSMQAGKHIGKVIIEVKEDDVVQAVKPPLREAVVDPDCAYLITGGTGGIGRSITRWLVRQGAKTVILVSRTGEESSAVQMLIEEIAALGCGAKVLVTRCDVRNREQLKILADKYNKIAPIRGIIHGAMVLRDTLFEKSTWEDWVDVTEPRVQGAWNLHYCFPDLDFFIMLSSVTSFYGNHGQAAYAASNSFLDAFAAYRRLHGLPAATIDLSIVEDVGYIAETDGAKRAQFESQGHDKIREDELLSLLKATIIHKADGCDYQQTTNGLKLYPNLKLPWWAFDPKVSHILHGLNSPTTKTTSTSQAVRLEKLLTEATSVAQATHVVRDALVRKISQLSTTPPEDIEPDQPLLAYGLDSLIAVELRNWMVSELGSRVSLLELTNSPSIDALATVVAAQSSFVHLTAFSKGAGVVET